MSEEGEIGNEIINLKIKTARYEISVNGSVSYLTSNINEIIEFTDLLNERFNIETTDEVETPTPEEISEAPIEDVPVIRVTRRTQDNISSLFDTDWGRTPRSAAEVVRALEVNAVPDTSTHEYLRRLVQRRVLRRMMRDGRYHYIKIPEEE